MRLARERQRITGYPNPFETYLLIAAVVQGALVATGAARPATLEAAYSGLGWLRWVWATLMLLGGILALLGLYWRGDPFLGVEIKRVGLVMTGFGSLAYGAALLLSGRVAWVAGPSATALAIACAVRLIQVSRMLRVAEQEVAHARRSV